MQKLHKPHKLTFLLFLLVLKSQLLLSAPLTITFLNVGLGDAILLKTPNNKTILIDTGKKYLGRKNIANQIILPYLKKQQIKKIDLMILTHPHEDHIGSAANLIKKIQINKIIDCGTPFPSVTYSRLLKLIMRKKIRYQIPRAGETLKIDPSLKIKVLNPPPSHYRYTRSNANNNSLVLMLTHGKIKILFCADIETTAQRDLIASNISLSCDLIKVPHHGSNYSAYPLFIQRTACKYAIISVSSTNPFGTQLTFLPGKKAIQEYIKIGAKILRTDKHGHIIAISDGKNLSIRHK